MDLSPMPGPSWLHWALLQERFQTGQSGLLTLPTDQMLYASDPILYSHPKRYDWQQFWIIGVAIARYMRGPNRRIIRNSAGPVVEILVGQRREGAPMQLGPPYRGPCERHVSKYWAIPTAYVERDDKRAIDTLAGAVAKDLGLPLRKIVGCCRDESWQMPLPRESSMMMAAQPGMTLPTLERNFRQATYVVLTHADGNDLRIPEDSEYSDLEWIQLELLEPTHSVSMTGDTRKLLKDAFAFAECYHLE